MTCEIVAQFLKISKPYQKENKLSLEGCFIKRNETDCHFDRARQNDRRHRVHRLLILLREKGTTYPYRESSYTLYEGGLLLPKAKKEKKRKTSGKLKNRREGEVGVASRRNRRICV